MRIAQSLYEAGRITYMRTDSMNLSTLCLNACGPLIAERMGESYHQRRTFHTHTKGAQEAHEAIRPTDMRRDTVSGTVQERRLYELIWKRTVACQMADAQLERTTATISISGRKEQFVATGEVILFDGFLKVYRESSDTQAGEEEAESRLLPHMEEGEHPRPATITAAVTFPVQYGREVTIVAILLALAVNLFFMLEARRIGTFLMKYNIMNPLIRIIGLIVATIGLQMIFDGISSYIATLG